MSYGPSNIEIQELYIRICRDSKFKIDWVQAAQLTASVLQITPLMVGLAFPYVERMRTIADGNDPVLTLDKKD